MAKSDKERIHRWITQAELEEMLRQAFKRGAEMMRQQAAAPWRPEISDYIEAMPLPEYKP